MQSQRTFIREIKEDCLRYMGKNRSRRWSQSRGLYLPSEGDIAASNRNILFDADFVKRGEEFVLVKPGEEGVLKPQKIAAKDIPLEDMQAVFPAPKITQDDGGSGSRPRPDGSCTCTA